MKKKNNFKFVYLIYGERATGKSLFVRRLLKKSDTEVFDDVMLTFENGKEYTLKVLHSKKHNFVFIINNYNDYCMHNNIFIKVQQCLIDRLKIDDNIFISSVEFKRE